MINYTIKRSNGKIYATIENNVILGPNQPNQNPVPINLLGRNKVSYGQALNENFLWLAENFAGEAAPRGSVPGQIWYNYTSNTGQLLISLVDSARQPDPEDPSTELEWASIPMITLFNTIPDADSSIMGRMVLTNNGDSLMVLMKDKEWREIQTTRPTNKELSSLLDINYDLGKKYIEFNQSNAFKDIAFFNSGGALNTNENGYTYFQDGQGALHFGSNYFYELKVMAREVQMEEGVLKPITSTFKTWLVKGSFYVNNSGKIDFGVTLPNELPDPRQLDNMTQITDVINQGGYTQNWNITMKINTVDADLPSQTDVTKEGYADYVNASLNSKKHLGFKLEGNVPGLQAGESVLTQWSVLLKMTGISPGGV